ncbi:TetR/AcrR family transcriptional regulator [Vagococcus coleopterorum]|uniref:TetR/AcrR family transcriptional regulator n=1 Tax=Vagococcus coleopterorum TaxID=2714946 RepID=A0A6G8ANF2_9ENTE|nr:TetR/AcrR family transcriptional regulator [Vagococcus coleopterorum]QIL46455.1 TetR/AcrR family transcriptional regulator [Vagococcus coleopterorum]
MPTETFFNLKPEKKNLILNAAFKEFSQHNIHDALVSNIVADSNISRGAFYKYFTDIEDLYYFVYRQITEDAHSLVIDGIKRADGDLFLGIEYYLSALVLSYSTSDHQKYFETLTLNTNYELEHKLSGEDQSESSASMKQFARLINPDNLLIQSKAEMIDFLKVLTPLIHQCMIDYFVNKWDEDELITQYHRRIKWLKHGVLKNE